MRMHYLHIYFVQSFESHHYFPRNYYRKKGVKVLICNKIKYSQHVSKQLMFCSLSFFCLTITAHCCNVIGKGDDKSYASPSTEEEPWSLMIYLLSHSWCMGVTPVQLQSSYKRNARQPKCDF